MSESKQDEPVFPDGLITTRRAIPAPPSHPSVAAYEDWLEALQRLQFPVSILHDPLLVEEFTTSMLAVTQTWSTSYFGDLDRLHELCDQYSELRSRLLNLAPDVSLLESDDLLLDFGELHLILSERNNPDPYLRELEWLTGYWDKYYQLRQKIHRVLEPRFTQIESVLSAFTGKHRLPPVALTISEDSGLSDNLGAYQQGQIEINLYLLVGTVTGPELVETIYHELVHGEQDALVLRCLADRVKSHSGEAMEEYLDRIEMVYRESLQLTDWPSCRPFMKSVLALREGVELTAQEQWRAAYLIAAWHKGRCVSEKEGDILERLSGAVTILNKLGSLTELSHVLKLIGETRRFKEAMCDSEELPDALATLVELARLNDWQPLGVKSSVLARDALLGVVRERIDCLQSLMNDNWESYRLTHDENEAWVIAAQARLIADRQLTAQQAVDRET